jgi:hypothetical protein
MTRVAYVGFCLAVALQAQSPRDTRAPAANAPAGTASIEGTVVSDEAQPKKLRRALVALSGPSLPALRMEITDDEGRFRFTGLKGAQYALAVTKEGYATRFYGSSRPVPSGRGAPSGPLNLSIRDGEVRSLAMRLPRGAVITGTVLDGGGQPLPGTSVVVMADRFSPVTGSRQLRPVDASLADDRGVYRIFGLPAGQYVVYAQVSSPMNAQELKRTASDARDLLPSNTYYPSTPDGTLATRITVAAGEERAGIDIQPQYVPTATVKGFVSGGAGTRGAVVRLTSSSDLMGARLFASPQSVGPDGQFAFTGVEPGQYEIQTAVSSPSTDGSGGRTWMWGLTEIAVDGDDITNVGVQLMPTFTITGRVAFEGSTTAPALAPMGLPVSFFSTTPTGVPAPSIQLLDGGRFSITGVTPGVYRPNSIGTAWRGVQTPIGPWWVKSVVVDGRELLDAPLELRQSSDNAVITLADQASDVAGSAKDASGSPVPRGFVVIYSADRAYWFVNSRRVVATVLDSRGHYEVRNLPPGEYRAAIALDLEQGEWFDPDVLQSLQATAVPFTIAGIESKTVDVVLR